MISSTRPFLTWASPWPQRGGLAQQRIHIVAFQPKVRLRDPPVDGTMCASRPFCADCSCLASQPRLATRSLVVEPQHRIEHREQAGSLGNQEPCSETRAQRECIERTHYARQLVGADAFKRAAAHVPRQLEQLKAIF